MPHTETRAEPRTSRTSLFGWGLESLLRMMAAVKAWQRTAATRKSLQDLTSDQLRDIGFPEPSLPRLDIKAGLITNLTSMR
jgi:uncharacterized protein YjiS (DUF1127 family)